jgi:hypothetical protein
VGATRAILEDLPILIPSSQEASRLVPGLVSLMRGTEPCW